jgi:hypothetical protein
MRSVLVIVKLVEFFICRSERKPVPEFSGLQKIEPKPIHHVCCEFVSEKLRSASCRNSFGLGNYRFDRLPSAPAGPFTTVHHYPKITRIKSPL